MTHPLLPKSAFSSPKKIPQCKLMGLSAFILWGSRQGLLPKFWHGKRSPSGDTPSPRPQTPSLQIMAGFIPCILAGAGAEWGRAEPGHCVGTAGGPKRADGAAEAGAGRPSGRAGAGAALAQPRQAGTGLGAARAQGPSNPSQGLDRPPLLSLSFSSSPGSCHGAESGPSPSVS